jgi:hypothetical protein
VIAVALAVIAVKLVVTPSGPDFGAVAMAQPSGMVGTRGVFAFPGQMAKGSYGLYMVDADTMTIWAYEYLPQKGCLRLAASRTWRYDRYLENYNTCDLPPAMVEQMIDQQRQERLQTSEDETP